MYTQARKVMDNPYTLARLRGSKHRIKLKSREGAAELLNIHEATLCKYETGSLNVSNDMVLQMSEVYSAPELLNWYCCNECAIGRKTRQNISLKDVALIALDMNDTTDQMEKYNKLFIKIAKDNSISEHEEEVVLEILKYFHEIQKVIEEYSLLIRKHFMTKEKARQV